jgi:3-dehydroquinate dehydratase type II
MKILILNGPNLNFLGIREPEIYGSETLPKINDDIAKTFKRDKVKFEFFQSNYEGELIDKLQECHFSDTDAVVYNPGAHTHYSYALHDAVASIKQPVIEVHLSDITKREGFRKKSVISPACEMQISGKGKDSYIEAIRAILNNDGDMFWKRSVKNSSEIEILRSAQKIADEAFLATLTQIHVGMSEIQVKDILENQLKAKGAEGFSFETLVGAGANGANIHAMPSENVLRRGDAVVIDFGVVYKGLCSDTTRTIFVGRPKREIRAAWEAVRDAHETVASKISSGVTGKEMHELALSVLKEHGYDKKYMPHGLGHGVGRDIHEKPVLAPRGVQKLEAGNVITIEPGIYKKDKFGIRLEDCGVLTKGGFESFTSLTHEMIIV